MSSNNYSLIRKIYYHNLKTKLIKSKLKKYEKKLSNGFYLNNEWLLKVVQTILINQKNILVYKHNYLLKIFTINLDLNKNFINKITDVLSKKSLFEIITPDFISSYIELTNKEITE